MFRFLKNNIHNLLFLITILATQAGAKDYAGPYRPLSTEFDHVGGGEFIGWDEAAFSKLPVDDVRLKRAYLLMFGASAGPDFYFTDPEWTAALADLRKRGDTVTPMLLKLMSENEETGFESNVLSHIAYVKTINVEPYLEYARHILRERTQTMSGGLAGCAASLMAVSGTKEDGELLKWVMETRPYVADAVTRELDALNRRLNLPKQETRPPLKDRPVSDGQQVGDSQSVGHKAPSVIGENKQDRTRWIAWVLVILVVGGLLGLALAKRK